MDLGYVPNPQTALRQAELGVAATNGYIEGSTAGDQNLYTIGQPEFNAYVATTLLNGEDIPKVFETFQKNLKYPVGMVRVGHRLLRRVVTPPRRGPGRVR